MAKNKKTLRESHPEIAGMWVYELNGELTPDDVSIHSHTEVYFQCRENPKHIYKKPITAMISRRDNHIINCIYCGPNAKVPFPGETDLLSVVKEANYMWDYDKNTLDPATVLPESNKFAYFKCEFGHSTYRKIQHFSHSPYCIHCQKLNTLLVSNIPQTKIFWDFDKNIGVELDNLIQSSRNMVWFKCPECDYEWNVTITLWRKHSYCSCCGFDGKYYRKINNIITTLKMKAPEVVELWDYDKNSKQTPNSLTWNSNFNAYFKCNLGHEFNRPIRSLFNNDEFRGCIICNPKFKIIYPNDRELFTECMEAKEMWDFELNRDLSPQSLTINSKETAHFICSNGHKFETKINLFAKNPICKECKRIKNRSIVIKRPDMFQYWDISKNDINPYLISPNDKREAFWRCDRCNVNGKS